MEGQGGQDREAKKQKIKRSDDARSMRLAVHASVTDQRKPKVEYTETCCVTPHPNKQTKPRLQFSLELSNVYYVSSNAKSSQFGAMLYIFKENEAAIKMIMKGRSPTLRHVSRTHRVAVTGCLTE